MRERALPGARADARRRQPRPRRHVPVLCRARRPRPRARSWPTTPSPATIRSSPAIPIATSDLLRRVASTPGGADRAVDARRLHPRGDEHRQHDDLGRDDRLRSLRVHGGVRPEAPSSARSTRTGATPTATSRPIAQLEPGALRRDPAAADRSGVAGRGHRARDRRASDASPAITSRTGSRASAPSWAWTSGDEDGDCGARRRLAGAALRAVGRLHAWRGGGWPTPPRATSVPLSALFTDRAAPVRLAGRWSPARFGARTASRRRRRARHAARQPALHPAQSPRRRSARRPHPTHGDLDAFEALLEVVTHPFDERPGLGALRRAGAARGHGRYQTFCGT